MTMKRYAILVMLVHCFGGIGAGLGADATGKLAPEALEARIRQHRMGELVVRAKPGAAVHVEQLRHEFWFGAALSSRAFGGRMSAEDRRRYEETFLANFNAAVTENAVKWASMERRRGHVDYSVVDAMLAWTAEHDIPLRGHNVFWGIPNRVQDWLKQMDDDELRETLKNRATDIARRYRGRFAEYDLNNEMLHANYYEDRLGAGITKDMADWFKQADPDARLYLNDYDILTGNRLDDYIKQIRGFLDQGVPVAGIGVQGHLSARGILRPQSSAERPRRTGQDRPADLYHRVQHAGPAFALYERPRLEADARAGTGQGQSYYRILPYMLRPSGGRWNSHVGVLGGRQLDSSVLALSPGLDAHAGGGCVSRFGLQRMVDPRGR